MKILKVVVLGGLSLILAGVIILFERNNWPAGSSLSGIALGFSVPAFWKSLQDHRHYKLENLSEKVETRGLY